jgi:HK97 family phage major capsid protein
MATMTISAKSILFGDFSKYLIRDVRDFTLLRLDERYAEFLQVAFLAFMRSDGDLLNAGTVPDPRVPELHGVTRAVHHC